MTQRMIAVGDDVRHGVALAFRHPIRRV